MEKTHKVKSTESNGLQREWTKIVAQAWADPDFRKRLEKNPRAVLKERGVDVPDDVNLEISDKPVELDEVERAVRPIDMAVAAGFAAPPMPGPMPQAGYGGDYFTGGYADPATEAAYAWMVDPTLEGRWKVGLCLNIKATIGACAHFQWGAAQPYPTQQPFPQQVFPQQPIPQMMPSVPYGPPQPQQPPTAAYAGAAETLPYYPGDPYAAGLLDPTLDARRWKVGLCINVKATGGGCAYFHWGAAQPFPTQQPFPQQPFPQQPFPQQVMPSAPYGPPQPQLPPTAAYAGGGAEILPYYPDDVYGASLIDPTLEARRWKVGLCINVKATGGGCAYFHWGAAQPFPTQQQFPQQPIAQPPTPAACYATPPQPQQTTGPQQPMGPQQPTTAWAATVPTQCFSGAAAAPPFVPPGHPQYHIQPYPGPQTRPAFPQTRPAVPGSA
jgi:hypothetical protein